MFDLHILGAYGHIQTKYEVSMCNLWLKGVCTDDDINANDDDAQSMIV